MAERAVSEAADEFGRRIARADATLFDAISAELTTPDRRSLLLIQDAVRGKGGGYVYVEIGSHLGGSIQPHLLDDCCQAIHSIDPRPAKQADARGPRMRYPGNLTSRMLEKLERLSAENVCKVRTYEVTAAELAASGPPLAADLVFIDGEHTKKATLADFKASLRLAGDFRRDRIPRRADHLRCHRMRDFASQTRRHGVFCLSVAGHAVRCRPRR